jgi:hypothetical protein
LNFEWRSIIERKREFEICIDIDFDLDFSNCNFHLHHGERRGSLHSSSESVLELFLPKAKTQLGL